VIGTGTIEISEKVLKKWKEEGLADEHGDFNLLGTAMSTFLFYCDQCDHLHLGLCIRDMEKKVSSFFEFGNVEELERLALELNKAIAVFKNEGSERALIESMEKDGYLWWTLFKDK